MGTLIGPAEAIVLRPEWMLERQLDGKLRGYGDLDDGPAVWMAEKAEGGERFLFVVKSRDPQPEDHDKAVKMAEGDEVRLLALRRPDFRPLLPYMRASRETLDKLYADIPSRTTRITMDAKLQTQVAGIIKQAAKRARRGGGRARCRHRPGPRARAVAGLRSGQREVHAAPDRPRLPGQGQEVHRRLWALAGQDGRVRGVPGRIGREGDHVAGRRPRGPARLRDRPRGQDGSDLRVHAARRSGAVLHTPGWYKAIHDHPEDPIHGNIDYIKASP